MKKSAPLILSVLLLLPLPAACGKSYPDIPYSADTSAEMESDEAEQPNENDEAAFPETSGIPARNHIISDPGDDSEQALRTRISAAVDGEILMFNCGDYDGDGKNEAFAWAGSYDEDYHSYDGHLWFVNAWETIEVNGAPTSCWVVDNGFSFDNRKFIILEQWFATGSLAYVYGVKDGKPYLRDDIYGGSLRIADRYNIYITQDSYDLCYDKELSLNTGHTWKRYYLYWDNGFKEYGGIPITEKQLLEFDGAEDILKEIRTDGSEIINIIYRANGIININCEFEDEYNILYRNITLSYDEKSVKTIDRNDGEYLTAFLDFIAVYPKEFVHPKSNYMN